MTITQPLREEHKELLPKIKELSNLAESVDTLPEAKLQERLKAVLDFLQRELIPHALAEDEVLYPTIDALAHFSEATKTMKYDHNEIAKATRSLSENVDNKTHLQRILCQLSLLVSLHFEKEEAIYLPFLDKHLSQNDANSLFAKMETAAARIKATLK